MVLSAHTAGKGLHAGIQILKSTFSKDLVVHFSHSEAYNGIVDGAACPRSQHDYFKGETI